MVFQFVFRHFCFADDTPLYRGFDRGWRFFKQLAVGAGLRHPCQFVHIVRRQSEAGRHEFTAFVIYRAAHLFFVKIAADDICIVNAAGVFVFKLYQAAFATTAADIFPFGRRIFFHLPIPFVPAAGHPATGC